MRRRTIARLVLEKRAGLRPMIDADPNGPPTGNAGVRETCVDCGLALVEVKLSGGKPSEWRCARAPGLDKRCSTWVESAYSYTWLIPDGMKTDEPLPQGWEDADENRVFLAIARTLEGRFEDPSEDRPGFVLVPMRPDDERFVDGVKKTFEKVRENFPKSELVDASRGAIRVAFTDGPKLQFARFGFLVPIEGE